ncbi:GNAT family N-acetyltransferase [Streptomyces sp. H10-C2]|uniref:bifunctional acetate--CoA ligase family protein/GNAT family N-acetyltransferase n=1 Tax=unclassified Streptomyces TaxID=2593676 RepID=UPI0024BA7C7B|nr:MULTISPECIES: bifunctional GNAT family N-acetyltransferase/acetate--CoA ligase family protein [unclassified Streptomyces]MDJ0341560.1 GNAT family N-acetyltransferase [Streptomyces sp. PH10-H1]MDJ0371338.1 GNAT family N-acetyltransferase [Streptomyces sp. H10-C2]
MTTPAPRPYPVHWEADVVLRDGGIAHIRPIGPWDAQRLVDFYEQVSDESKYYRFFAPYPRLSDRDVHRFTHHDYDDRVGLAATIGDEFIATVRYDRIDADGRPASGDAYRAEVAFLVQDAHQGRGVASALLEHIGAVARERGILRFIAEVLPANRKMVKVFTDAGYTQQRSFTDGVVHLELDLEPTEASVQVMRAREHRAEARSVQRLLTPRSVAVIGASRRPGGVGRTLLRNLVEGGFTGRVHAVNRSFPEGETTLDGVRAHRTVAGIPEPVDLAIIAVPADSVPAAVAACGEHGVQGLVVVTAGYAESGPEGRALQRELVRQARSYGMRVIGPNAFGIINTAAGVRLNASLSPEVPATGRLGLFTQSGAIGIALLSGLHRRGAGLSSFVSAGNRADVSGNDLLQYWHNDPDTDAVLMYLESFGNPRKFTRLAKRTAAAKPVVVVKGALHSGTTPAGHAVSSTRIPDSTVSALFRQAGVIRVDTVTELLDVGLLLSFQPIPGGGRVAILGNSDSLGLLTYDAALTAELQPAAPLDLTTAATPDDFRTALTSALADDAVDAVVVTAIPRVGCEDAPDPESGDDPALSRALRAAAAGARKPVVVAHLALETMADRLGVPVPGPDDVPESALSQARIPAYPAADRAVRALAEAVAYARWRREAEAPGRVPQFADIEESAAAADVARLLDAGEVAGESGGESGVLLDDAAAAALLGRYGIAVRSALPAPGIAAALDAARRLGYPVALKTTAPHLRHRADLGGVRLDLADEGDLRRAYEELTARLGKAEELLLVVQAMAPRGVDTVVRATVDPAVGAVLSFGLAGAPSELLGDTAHRLVPATDRDAAELVRSIKAAPILFGWRGSEPVDTGALEELLLRVSLLVDDLPEAVAVDLEPVVVAAHGLTVLGASVRLDRPPARTDLGPRALSSF